MTVEKTLKISKSFWQGMAGGFVGVVIFFLLLFGFFALMDKLSQTKIDCVLGKEIQKGNIKCQVLEIKERGNVLKISEMLSPPKDKEELQKIKDKATTGRFVEVRFEIENMGRESQGVSEITLVDDQNREYSNLGGIEIEYWLPSESQEFWNIIPGIKKELIQIFEVPKDAQNLKLRLVLWRSGLD